jgi:U3 small nucleolar RNA-associated protein 22
MGKAVRLKETSNAPAKKKHKKEVTSLADLSEEDDFSGSDVDDGETNYTDSQASDEDINDTGNEDDELNDRGAARRPQLNAQEIQVARETSELFKSNIFKMQIDELLGELKLDPKRTTNMDRLLFRLHTALQNVEPFIGLDLIEAERQFSKSGIVIPFPDPKPVRDVKYTFGFDTPASINIVGSYNLKTAVRQPEGTGIDMCIQMPPSLFQEKDYLNYRYFHKRAFYAACIARHLNKQKDIPFKVSYGYQARDALRPILRLDLQDKKLSKFYINILFGVDSNTFPRRKLGPERNCVRQISVS